MEKLFTKGTKIVDSQQRERIFHGVNMVYKGHFDESVGRNCYIANWTEDDFDWLRDNGFHLIRLGIIWDGLEHTQGDLDGAYLNWLKHIVQLCYERNIYVFLDMHQDLFSVKFADGAPEWATLGGNKPHYNEGIWSDSYLLSEAVKTSFDAFWANEKLPNGVGIQDHYAALWGKVVDAFQNYNNVLGFDLMNEPYTGSSGLEIFATLLGAYGEITQKNLSIEELMEMFTDDEEKVQMLMEIDNHEIYQAMASAVAPLIQHFDSEILNSFYQKVRDAIREKCSDGIIMLENNYFSNMGIPSQVRKIKEEHQIYAPHGYDLVVDSPAVALSSNNRVNVIFEGHREVQERLQVPVIVGEWGAHYEHKEALDHITHLQNKFDQYHWSHTYWCYEKNLRNCAVLPRLIRPYPMAVSGTIQFYSYDQDTHTFDFQWIAGESSGETIIFLPSEVKEARTDVSYQLIEISETSSGKLMVISTKDSGAHRLEIIFH